MAMFLTLPSLSLAAPPYPVFGYFPNWSGGINNNNIRWDAMTHVSEAFALPQAAGNTPTLTPRPGMISTAHANGVKVMMSIGGATASLANWNDSTDAGSLPNFVTNIMNLVDLYSYDGVDIDWEFPNAGNGAPGETVQFTNLMTALYDALKNPLNPDYKGPAFDGSPRQLTFFVSPGYDICGVNWNSIAAVCDFAIMGGYDFYWGPAPSYNGPIDGSGNYGNCFGWTKQLDVTSTFETLTAGGAQQFSFPANQLILALPFYGINPYVAVSSIIDTGTKVSFSLPAGESRWNDGTSFQITDAEAFCYKINWALGQGMAGIGMWEITQAYPPTMNAEMIAMWDAIGGVAACTNPNSPTVSPTALGTFTHTPTVTPTYTSTPTPSNTPPPSYVALPFCDDFESGALGSPWLSSSQGTARIRVSTNDGPNSGSYHVLMDNTANGGAKLLNELTLHVNMQGMSLRRLEFYVKNFGDEFDTMSPGFTGSNLSDGVAISENGLNWIRITSLTPAAAYGLLSFDLEPIMAGAGFTDFSQVRIKFQQADNWSIPSDGFGFDDICVLGTFVTPTYTVTGTFTPTPSFTVTPTATFSATVTLSPTSSHTPNGSFTATPTATATYTFSPSSTATLSFTDTPTWTVTPTQTVSFTVTLTVTNSATATISPTFIPVASPTMTPAAIEGQMIIIENIAAPNPNPQVIHFESRGWMNRVELRLYTPGMTMAGHFEAEGPFRPGIHQVMIPAGFTDGFANGMYYFRLGGINDEEDPITGPVGKLFILK